MPTSLFIVDDHFMVVEGIHSLLQNESSIEWMGHAGNAASCLAFLQQQRPDVILMDISLPDQSGIELCREVKERYSDIFIIGLSTFSQKSFSEKMIANGASGYVLKNATRQELMEAINTVVCGKQYLSFDAAVALRKADSGGSIPVITRREKEVLELIAEGMTNNIIAGKLFISNTTVDTHRKNLLLKLGAKNTASLIRIATQLDML